MIGLMTSAVWTVPRTIYTPTATIIHLMVSPCHGSEFNNDICFSFKVIKFNFTVDFTAALIAITF